MAEKLITSQDYSYNDIHNLASRSNMSLGEFFKSTYVQDAQNNIADALVYDTGESKYIKDESYGLGYFPTNAFELLEMAVHLPITGFFAPELVPFKVGGGAVELVSAFRSQNATVEMQLATGQGNSIPTVGGAVEKYSVPVYAWEAGIKIGKLDMIKAERGNYSIISHRMEALRQSYWYRIERSALQGNIGIDGITSNAHANFVGGLLNQPASRIGGIITPSINVGGTDYDINLDDMDIDQLVTFFAELFQTIKSNVRLNPRYLPNRFALYPELYGKLTAPATLGTGAINGQVPAFASKLDYLEFQLTRLAKTEVRFVEVPYLSPNALTQGYIFREAGANDLGRIVIYRQDADMFTFPIPMELTISPIVYSPAENAYRQHGLTFMGAGLLIHRPQTIWYVDNVETEEIETEENETEGSE